MFGSPVRYRICREANGVRVKKYKRDGMMNLY